MKKMLISSLVLGWVGCGVGGAPVPEELIGDEAAAKLYKVEQNNGNEGNHGNHGSHGAGHQSSSDHGWKHGWGGSGHDWDWSNHSTKNRCSVQTVDPLVNQMPPTALHQDFEHLPLGNAPALYHWLDAPGSEVSVSKDTAYEGKQSLKIVSKGNTSAAYDMVGVKFCVRCEAMERFTASFAVRFESFVSWNGIAITDNPNLAYWWWLRSTGTLFDDVTFATLQPKTWYVVTIDIDRKKDLATITVGNTVHTAPLSTTWYADAAKQPMGCMRVMNISETAQTFYIDNVKVLAVK